MEIIRGSYWIVGGQEKEELFASLQLGDNQHRRDYPVSLRSFASGVEGSVSGDVFSVRLRVDGLKRTRTLNDVLDYEAVVVLPTGLIRVRGHISVAKWQSVRGDLHTIPKKTCEHCLLEKHTDRNRCDDCGEVLKVIYIPTLI